MDADYVWDLAGISRRAYIALSWPEKKKLLRKFKGIRIAVLCDECGGRLSDVVERRQLADLPPRLRRHPFGLLIAAYQKDVAEKESIKRQFPGAVFDTNLGRAVE